MMYQTALLNFHWPSRNCAELCTPVFGYWKIMMMIYFQTAERKSPRCVINSTIIFPGYGIFPPLPYRLLCRQFKHFFIFVILSNPIGFLIYESLSRAPAWLFFSFIHVPTSFFAMFDLGAGSGTPGNVFPRKHDLLPLSMDFPCLFYPYTHTFIAN